MTVFKERLKSNQQLRTLAQFILQCYCNDTTINYLYLPVAELSVVVDGERYAVVLACGGTTALLCVLLATLSRSSYKPNFDVHRIFLTFYTIKNLPPWVVAQSVCWKIRPCFVFSVYNNRLFSQLTLLLT